MKLNKGEILKVVRGNLVVMKTNNITNIYFNDKSI